MSDIELRGPILRLSMEELVQGHETHGHNFKDLIDTASDQIEDFAEYHVKLENDKFVVYYLTFDDIEQRDQDRYRVGYAIGEATANRLVDTIQTTMKETISTEPERDGFKDAIRDIIGNLE